MGGGPKFSPPPASQPTVFELPPAPPEPLPPAELTGGPAPTSASADPEVQARVAAAARSQKKRKGRRQTVLAGGFNQDDDAPEGAMATTLLGGGRLPDQG
jgi:hypothetical protein